MPTLGNGSKGDPKPGFLDCESGNSTSIQIFMTIIEESKTVVF